jgi:hypothetical protein
LPFAARVSEKRNHPEITEMTETEMARTTSGMVSRCRESMPTVIIHGFRLSGKCADSHHSWFPAVGKVCHSHHSWFPAVGKVCHSHHSWFAAVGKVCRQSSIMVSRYRESVPTVIIHAFDRSFL